VISKKIKGNIKGTIDVLRGVFIIYECRRCKKQKGEFISITERKKIMPEYVEAYSKKESGDINEDKE